MGGEGLGTSTPAACTAVCPVCGRTGISVPEEGRRGRYVREVFHGWDDHLREIRCRRGALSIYALARIELSIFDVLNLIFPLVTIKEKK